MHNWDSPESGTVLISDCVHTLCVCARSGTRTKHSPREKKRRQRTGTFNKKYRRVEKRIDLDHWDHCRGIRTEASPGKTH